MTVITKTTEELAAQFPALATDMEARGIVASAEVFSEKCDARCLAYIGKAGNTELVYGSRSLFDRWSRERQAAR